MKKPVLSEMTLREKIGQMLAPHHWDVYGKVGSEYDYSTSNIDDVKALYAKEQFGTIRGEQIGVFFADPAYNGIALQAENYVEGNLFADFRLKVETEPYKEFLEKHNTYMKIPALVGGDCTIGAANVFSDLSWYVNAAAIGAADSEELTYAFAAAIAKEMRSGGFNWRWAPVVDLENRNSYATLRTFAMDDIERTIRLTNAYVRGLQSEGVAATIKHFPGGGRTEARDAHFTSVCNETDMQEWWREQGKIYREVLPEAYAVMISHTSFPAMDDRTIDGRFVPSTISKKVVTDLLKGELGYKGVVVTDGIGMAGLFSLMPYEELIVELVNAGNDVILGSKLSSGDLIEAAVLDGRIEESRIDDACSRVLEMKEKLGLFDEDYGKLQYTAADVVAETRRISAEIAKRSLTLVRDRMNVIPFDQKNIKKVSIIISTHAESFVKDVEALKEAFEARGIEVSMQRRLKSGEELKEISDNSDLIVYAAFLGMHQPAGYPRFFAEEATSFYHAFVHGKEKSVGVSFGYPYIHYDTMENAPAFINAYNPQPETMRAVVAALLGEIELVGNSPVLLEPMANSK